jgi:hypothetical protein
MLFFPHLPMLMASCSSPFLSASMPRPCLLFSFALLRHHAFRESTCLPARASLRFSADAHDSLLFSLPPLSHTLCPSCLNDRRAVLCSRTRGRSTACSSHFLLSHLPMRFSAVMFLLPQSRMLMALCSGLLPVVTSSIPSSFALLSFRDAEDLPLHFLA